VHYVDRVAPPAPSRWCGWLRRAGWRLVWRPRRPRSPPGGGGPTSSLPPSTGRDKFERIFTPQPVVSAISSTTPAGRRAQTYVYRVTALDAARQNESGGPSNEVRAEVP